MELNNAQDIKYIYNLPYKVHAQLCLILNENNKWEELAGEHMGFSMQKIRSLRCSHNVSPAEMLLSMCNQRNDTVYELFLHLCKMQLHQATLLLKPYIDSKYHALIREASAMPLCELESRLPHLVDNLRAGENSRNVEKQFGPPSINPNLLDNISHKKYDTHKMSQLHAKPDNTEKKDNTSTMSKKDSDEAAAIVQMPTKQMNTFPSSPDNGRLDSGDTSIFSPETAACNNHIPYKELCIATNSWDQSNVLGRGGFGTVFRGHWKRTEVAIKRIEQRKSSDKGRQTQVDQLYKELKFLNSLRQDNILPLYGFSLDSEQPCLVCQLMPNGSLQDRIHLKNDTKPLNWVQRFNIALGTARGLQFLHTRYDKPLIHGDIKSANILLDADWTPRIGDFGLALEGPIANYTHLTVTSIHGTRPYLPLDFLRSKQASTKVDTYSFGIVLFEIITGQWAYEKTRKPELLRDQMRGTGDLRHHMDRHAPFDPILGPTVFQGLATIGQTCTANLAKERPEMTVVFHNLEKLQRDINLSQGASTSSNVSPQERPKAPINIDVGLNIPIPDKFYLTPNIAAQRSPLPGSISPNIFPFAPSPEFPTLLTTNTGQQGMYTAMYSPNFNQNTPQYSHPYYPSPLTPNVGHHQPMHSPIQNINATLNIAQTNYAPNIHPRQTNYSPNPIQNHPMYSAHPQQQNITHSPQGAFNSPNQAMYSPNPQQNIQNQQIYSANPQINQVIYTPNIQQNVQNQAIYSPNPQQNIQNQQIYSLSPAIQNQVYSPNLSQNKPQHQTVYSPNNLPQNQIYSLDPPQNHANISSNPQQIQSNPPITVINSSQQFYPVTLNSSSSQNIPQSPQLSPSNLAHMLGAVKINNSNQIQDSQDSMSSQEDTDFLPATLKSFENQHAQQVNNSPSTERQHEIPHADTDDLPNLSILGV